MLYSGIVDRRATRDEAANMEARDGRTDRSPLDSPRFLGTDERTDGLP